MFYEAIRTRFYRFVFNLLFSIVIVALLVVICASYYQTCLCKARVISFSGMIVCPKMSVMMHLAHHGVFPKDVQQALTSTPCFSDQNVPIYGKVLRNEIRNGAITVHFDNMHEKVLNGKKITLRPAIPIHDPMGPVCWVTTKRNSFDGLDVQGIDQTDIPSGYLPVDLGFKP